MLAEDPDLVVVATGGIPNTEFLARGRHLVSDGWDVLSGSFRARGECCSTTTTVSIRAWTPPRYWRRPVRTSNSLRPNGFWPPMSAG